MSLRSVAPAARSRSTSASRSPTSSWKRFQQEPQLAAREHRERRRRVHDDLEAEEAGVERDRRVDVVDDVANRDRHAGAERYSQIVPARLVRSATALTERGMAGRRRTG
jgi:hypothetical protein